MATVELNVSIEDEGAFEKTLKQAQAAGLKVTETYKDLGVVSGFIDAGALAGLRRIPGLHVEENRAVSAMKVAG